jgi:hypothetical protein
MIKGVLLLAVLLQLSVAFQTEGLPRALSELSAFLLLIALVATHKQQKQRKAKIEPEEIG